MKTTSKKRCSILLGCMVLGVCFTQGVMAEEKYFSASEAITDVHGLAFVDADGSKLAALSVEYSVPVLAESVSADSYRPDPDTGL